MMLDSRKEMDVLDVSGVTESIQSFPEQCEEAVKIGKEFAGKSLKGKIKKPEKVYFCGMGGSGIAGEMVRGFFPDKEVHVVKGYDLPAHAGRGDMVFVITYSGNTEETLSLFREAARRKCRIIGVTSGGKLEKECVEKGIDVVNVPGGLKPRFSLGYLFFTVIVILEKTGFLGKINYDLIIKNLKQTRDEIGLRCPSGKNHAKKMAKKLLGSVPIVQGFGKYGPVAYRAGTQFNENSKVPSFSENYPEMNHNSILGWDGGESLCKRFSVIMMRDQEEGSGITGRIEFTKELLSEKAGMVLEVKSDYPYELSRLLSTMYLLDFVSVYLALLRGKDPGDDSLIGKLKSILSGG